jgi:cell division septal protein FtsQ
LPLLNDTELLTKEYLDKLNNSNSKLKNKTTVESTQLDLHHNLVVNTSNSNLLATTKLKNKKETPSQSSLNSQGSLSNQHTVEIKTKKHKSSMTKKKE